MKKPTISVVVPVFRAENSISELCSRLISVLENTASKFEIILVEDCGGDGSWKIIKELASADQRVRGIKFFRNYGQHNALLCGIREAKNEIIITMDDDLQHPPEEIPKLLSALSDHDVVYGIPNKEQHGVLRNFSSNWTKKVIRITMGVKEVPYISSFRAFRSDLKKGFENFNSPLFTIDALLSWGTTNFTHIVVEHNPREYGKSNYKLRKLLSHTLNLITGFSTLPLRLSTIMGFVFMLFGAGGLVYVLYRYLSIGIVVPGFTFLASLIAIFSGVQLFALGIIGEYLARIFHKLSGKPSYIIGEQI